MITMDVLLAVFKNKWTHRLLFLLTILFVSSYITAHYEPESFHAIRISPFWLGISIVLSLVYITVYALLWHGITLSHKSAIPLPDAIAVWLFSNFGKYLPLKISGIGYRMAAYRERTSKGFAQVGQLCYIEYLSSILGGLVVIFIILIFLGGDEHLFRSNKFLYLICAGVLFILLLPSVHKSIFTAVLRIVRKEASVISMKPVNSVAIVLAYAAAWVLLGATLITLTYAVYSPVEAVHWPKITLYYAIAGIAGMLSFFAPSGFGVREGVLILGLATLMPVPVATVISILARLIATGADGIGILSGFLYLERTKRECNQ